MEAIKYYISGYCCIKHGQISVNGQHLFGTEDLPFTDFAKQAYQHTGITYPKFFKMDNLSKLAFLGAEFLLKDRISDREDNIALVFANNSSSLDTDVKYNDSIADKDNFYPSPGVFVYTLPNICLGEISIRHKLYTENSFFIFTAFNAEFFTNYANHLLNTGKAEKVLCGWVEIYKENYKAFLYIVSDTGLMEHSLENIENIYSK